MGDKGKLLEWLLCLHRFANSLCSILFGLNWCAVVCVAYGDVTSFSGEVDLWVRCYATTGNSQHVVSIVGWRTLSFVEVGEAGFVARGRDATFLGNLREFLS
jgi:hypothetical protein